MITEPPRILYRLSQTDQLTLEVFMSHEALGIPPRRPLSRRELDRWRGVSHQATLESALAKGTESPWLGRYVVEVYIPPGQQFASSRPDGTRSTTPSGLTLATCYPGS